MGGGGQGTGKLQDRENQRQTGTKTQIGGKRGTQKKREEKDTYITAQTDRQAHKTDRVTTMTLPSLIADTPVACVATLGLSHLFHSLVRRQRERGGLGGG